MSICILLLAGVVGCNTKAKQCNDFRTGKYTYVDKDRPELIIRTDSTQIEINPNTLEEIHATVSWLSECEYVMTYRKFINPTRDYSGVIGQEIYVEIIKTYSDGYRARIWSLRVTGGIVDIERVD